MECGAFLAGFSDYHDGSLPVERKGDFDAHMDECTGCNRYAAVVVDGTALFRSLPRPEIPESFRPRLQHRLYHEDDGNVLERGSSGSTAPVVTAVGMAILLTVVAWTPAFGGGHDVELPPIIVSSPPPPPRLLPRNEVFRVRQSILQVPLTTGDLWSDSYRTLYEYSTLSGRYRQSGVVRTGLD